MVYSTRPVAEWSKKATLSHTSTATATQSTHRPEHTAFARLMDAATRLFFFELLEERPQRNEKKTASQRDRGKVERRGREPRTIQFFQIRKQWKHYFFQVSSFCINFMKWIDAESAQRKEAEKQQQIVRKRFKLKRSTKQKISSYTYLEMAFEICSLDYIDWL